MKTPPDPWAARDRRLYPAYEPPSREFFIPGVDDPAEAEAQWARFAEGFRPECRRVHSLTYRHEGSGIEVTVGAPRRERRPKTGPHGGRLRNAGLTGPHSTGTTVLAIVDAGMVIEAWSEGSSDGGWHSPSFVGPESLIRIQYFKGSGPENGQGQ